MIIPTPLVPIAGDPYHVLLETLTRIVADESIPDNELLHKRIDEAAFAFIRAVHPSAAVIIDQEKGYFWYA